jgi:hypothetical protein
MRPVSRVPVNLSTNIRMRIDRGQIGNVVALAKFNG